VLLVAKGGEVSIGSPLVANARVKARVDGHGKEEKITVFKFKHKVRYRRKNGHRQPYTDLVVEEIEVGRARGRGRSRAKVQETREEG